MNYATAIVITATLRAGAIFFLIRMDWMQQGVDRYRCRFSWQGMGRKHQYWYNEDLLVG